MLKFHGIRFNPNGEPERYSLSFDLFESLNAGLEVYRHINDNWENVKAAVEKEINDLYANATPQERNSKSFRFLAAKWFRTKDILRFLFRNSRYRKIKVEVSEILKTPASIEMKWARIEKQLLKFFSTQSGDELELSFSDPDSELNLILQMAILFFLVQDKEVPPANLELQFIRGDFPKVIWKKRDGINSRSNPFWLPENPYCRLPYLKTRIGARFFKLGQSLTTHRSKGGSDFKQLMPRKQNLQKQPNITVATRCGSFLPTTPPDQIRLEIEGGDKPSAQLSLIPETPAETLISLQKLVQKRHSYEGVKHLLGILRQLSENNDGFCDFSRHFHLNLTSKQDKRGRFSDKQERTFTSVYSLLGNIKITRYWKAKQCGKSITNRLMTEIGLETTESDENGTDEVRKLLLDPLLLNHPVNPFRLGHHLRFIPDEIFHESVYKHSLLPGLSSFITGTWLNEARSKRGVAKKTVREILEGAAFNITPANKYRIRQRLDKELNYMTQKCYIGGLKKIESDNGNPWDDLYQLKAPDGVMQQITTQCIKPELTLGG